MSILGPDFVVTGTGRSGTGFIAQLLTSAGVPCGHERWFRPVPGLRERQPAGFGLRRRLREDVARRLRAPNGERALGGLRGDASWLAVPRLDRFDGLVFLQVREPLAVISSLAAMKFFTTRHGAFGDFARSHFEVGGDDVLDSMRWWVDWNRRAQGFATITYRLEDLNEQILASLLEQLGEDDVERRARLAFERSARPLNTSVQRGHEVRPLAWSDLPVGPERDAVTQLALELGYPGAG